MATFTYYIEVRQRDPNKPRYMVWREVAGRFKSRNEVDGYAAYIRNRSHTLDVRAVRIDGTLRHTINYRIGA